MAPRHDAAALGRVGCSTLMLIEVSPAPAHGSEVEVQESNRAIALREMESEESAGGERFTS